MKLLSNNECHFISGSVSGTGTTPNLFSTNNPSYHVNNPSPIPPFSFSASNVNPAGVTQGHFGVNIPAGNMPGIGSGAIGPVVYGNSQQGLTGLGVNYHFAFS